HTDKRPFPAPCPLRIGRLIVDGLHRVPTPMALPGRTIYRSGVLMPILQLQKRARELGRIRIGQKGPKGQPQKLDRFRITSYSKPLIEKVAGLYGGEVGPWTPPGGSSQWEVITDAARIPILVPPQPVTQFLETWSRAGIIHRCDGETNWRTGEPCDLDDPDHINARPTTRLKVVLRDVEG